MVLIPAYKPDHRLLPLTAQLLEAGFCVIVVDDGSGAEYENIFASLRGMFLVQYERNMGKGHALKTGIAEACRLMRGMNDCPSTAGEQGIITADADGQHTVSDIQAIAATMARFPQALVLGKREMNRSSPLRSRIGNGLTKIVFRMISGSDVHDTQTGLRGLPAQHLMELAKLPGERYEYEMNMLLWARPNRVPMIEIPIQTIYFDKNSGSHFHTLKDSYRIYRQLLPMLGHVLLACLIDLMFFMSYPVLGIWIASAVSGFMGQVWLVGRCRRHPRRKMYWGLSVILVVLGMVGGLLDGVMSPFWGRVCVVLGLLIPRFLLQRLALYGWGMKR